MPWPTGHDYQTAVQSSSISFKDPVLRSGEPELNQLGMPKPRSGSYAVAFKIRSGSRDYAVRCFLADSLDRQDRYLQIADFLKRAALRYTVEFGYQREGVLVGGKWYPILKMEWVHGESLGAYVAKNIASSQTLIALAARWVEMASALKSSGMAHGDLQHGNVLVMSDGQLKLIDYDGMYVPALTGRTSEELGQRNYQHPLRTAMDFGPSLDHFSEWVIYVSLVLVSLDPTLWSQLKGGDECLLFRKTDFDDPDSSPAFRALERAKDDRIRSLSTVFRTLLYFGVSQVPPLDGSSMPTDPQLSALTSKRRAFPGAPSSSWLADHVPVAVSADAGLATTLVVAEGPSSYASGAGWILDYLGPPAASQRFTNPIILERAALLLSAMLFGLSVSLSYLAAVVTCGALAFCNLALIAWRYSKQEIVGKARASAQRILEVRREIAGVNEKMGLLGRQRAAGPAVLQKELARIAADRNTIEAAESRDGERTRSQLKLTTSSITDARRQIADGDAVELRQLQHGPGLELLEAQRTLANLDQTQLKDLADTLHTMQRQHVSGAMNDALLDRGTIPGIGTGRRAALSAAGVRSAADMQRRGLAGIVGIGPMLQSQLLDWSRGIEAEAMRTRPGALISTTEKAIKDKYSVQRVKLEAKRNDLQRRLVTEQARITSMHQAQRDSLAQQERQANTVAAEELALIHKQYLTKYTANDGETTKARADHASRMLNLDKQANVLRQQLADLKWQVARFEHKHVAFRTISLIHYARRAVWPFTR